MKKKRKIAVIVDLSWTYQHHHGVVAGVHRYVEEQDGWDSVVAPFADPDLVFPGTGTRYDGIVTRAMPGLVARAKRLGVPLVNVYQRSSVKDVPSVFPDRAAVGRMAAQHLLARGIRRFACLGMRRNTADRLQRSAFLTEVKNAGCRCSVLLTNQSFTERERSWRSFQHELDDWIDTWSPPLGVFVAMDLECRCLANACRRKHLDVPNDVALIGTQNEPVVCLRPNPALSSIDLNYEEVGYQAAHLLHQLMDGRRPPGEPLIVPPFGVVPRHSTDVFAVEDSFITGAFKFISENCGRPIGVNEVAAAISCTRRSLERQFQTKIRRTVGSEITRLRVALVKRRLVESDLPLPKLAESCGYSDAKQMNKTFQRVEGMTPTAYRKRHRPS